MDIAALVIAVVAGTCAVVSLALGVRNDQREKARIKREEDQAAREEEQAAREAARAQREEEAAARSQTASPHAKHLSDAPAHAGHRAYTYEVKNTGQATAYDLHIELITADDKMVSDDVFVGHLQPKEIEEATVTIDTTVTGPIRVRFYWFDEEYKERHERISGAEVPLP